MKRLVKAIEKLREPSEPLEFITETGIDKTEVEGIIVELAEYLDKHPTVNALAAPQIGITKRIFCIKFNDSIKYFINPVITRKTGAIIAPEAFLNLPENEFLIARPAEITAVYYTDEFKYEENKFLGLAARIFDQMVQLFDGTLPDELGLISNIAEDGSLADATDEEMQEYIAIYKKFIAVKVAAAQTELANGSAEDQQTYKKLKFAEDVINNRTQIYEDGPKTSPAQKVALGAMQKVKSNAITSSFVKRKAK